MVLTCSYIRHDRELTMTQMDAIIGSHSHLIIFSWHIDSETGLLGSLNKIKAPLPSTSMVYRWLDRVKSLRKSKRTRVKILYAFNIDTPEPTNPGNYILNAITLRKSIIANTIVNTIKSHISQFNVYDGVSFDFEGAAATWAHVYPEFTSTVRAALATSRLPSYINSYISTRFYGLDASIWQGWENTSDHIILPIYSSPQVAASPTDAYNVFQTRLNVIESKILDKSKLLYIAGLFTYDWRTKTGDQAAEAYDKDTIFYKDIIVKTPLLTSPLYRCVYTSRQMTDTEILGDAICERNDIIPPMPVFQQVYWCQSSEFLNRFKECKVKGYGGFGYWYAGVEGSQDYLDILKILNA